MEQELAIHCFITADYDQYLHKLALSRVGLAARFVRRPFFPFDNGRPFCFVDLLL